MQLIVDRNVEVHGGRRLGATVQGDATVSVFTNALHAVRAAIALQRELTGRTGAVRVRAGLATGELVSVDRDIVGSTVNRAARVRELARAGEILLSASTADVTRLALPAGVDLTPLGPHVLRGLQGTDEIAAVVTEGVSAPPDPTRSPYPGLASFGPDDADLNRSKSDTVRSSVRTSPDSWVSTSSARYANNGPPAELIVPTAASRSGGARSRNVASASAVAAGHPSIISCTAAASPSEPGPSVTRASSPTSSIENLNASASNCSSAPCARSR
jgi:hypothetical protein